MARNARQSKDQVQSKIRFLEEQLVSLDHYLPETYEYLMAELDRQRLVLAEISVAEAFDRIDQDCSEQPQKEIHIEQTTPECPASTTPGPLAT